MEHLQEDGTLLKHFHLDRVNDEKYVCMYYISSAVYTSSAAHTCSTQVMQDVVRDLWDKILMLGSLPARESLVVCDVCKQP